MDEQKELGEREIRLVRDAAEWRLLSLMFECPNPDWASQVTALAREVGDEELRSAAGEALHQASEGLYHHAFGPGGPAPPREATYHRSVELGYLLSELQIYYNAFAFQPETAEPIDHISVETNFVAYLRFKESYALARGEEGQAAICADAAQSFIKEHLSKVAQPFAGFLDNSGVPYLSKAGAVLLRRVGPPAAPVGRMPITQEAPMDEPLECG